MGDLHPPSQNPKKGKQGLLSHSRGVTPGCQAPPLTTIFIFVPQLHPHHILTPSTPRKNSWHSSYAQPAIIKVVKLKQKAARRAPKRKSRSPSHLTHNPLFRDSLRLNPFAWRT